MKKQVISFMATALLSTMIPFVAGAADTDLSATVETDYTLNDRPDATSLFSEDFESGTASMDGTVTSDSAYAIGNVLEVTSSTTAQLTEGTDLFSTEYGPETIVVTEFDIKTENFNENADAQMLISLQDSEACADITRIKLDTSSFYMTVFADGTYYRYNELTDKKWYTVRLVTRITDTDGAAYNKNTKLYINGNNLVSIYAKDLGYEFLTTEGVYDRLSFEISNGKAYIDNVKVTRCYGFDNEPVNYGQLLTTIRKGDAKVADAVNNVVDATVLSTFNEALDSAKAVYESNASLDDVEVENDALCQAYADFLFKDESVMIGSVNFTDADGNEAVYLTNGGKISGVNVTKLAQYNTSVDVAVTVYDSSGTLTAVDYIQDALTNTAVDTRTTVPVDITLPADVTDCTVKVMVFDGNTNMSMLSDEYVPSNAETTIYVSGDSLVDSYVDSNGEPSKLPRIGWGHYVADYYTNVKLANWARSGATTRSLIDDQRFKNIELNIGAGDYLIVSYMANDEKKESLKRVTQYDYKNFLRYYADVAKSHGAQVIFVTSPPRLTEKNYDCYNGGYSKDDYYCQLMEAVAAELNAPVVDVYQKRKDLQTEMGYEYVESAMYLCNIDTLRINFNNPDLTEEAYPATDATHLNEWGAKKCASWIAEEMHNLDCGLRYRVNELSFYELPTGDDIVTSLELTSAQ